MASFDSFVGSGDELSGAGGGGGGGSQHGYMAFDSFRYSEDHSSPFEDGISAGANGFGAPSEGDDSPLPPPPYAAAPPSSQGGGSRMSAFEDDDIGLQHSPDLTSSGFSSHPFDSVDHHHHGAEFPSLDDVSSVVDSNGRGSFVGVGGGGGFGQDEIDGSVSDNIFGFDPHSSSNGTGAVLPPLEEMQREQGFQLREWRRQNAIRLAEKEKMEKEKLAQIVETADRFKEEFYSKRQTHCETSAKNNREKEKVYLANQESFHKNADKQYWKAVAELVPHELPTMEAKSRGKDKDKKKATTMVANNGPKPGKATDLSRMRQILVKLKHNLPDHMKPPPPPPAPTDKKKEAEKTAAGEKPTQSASAAKTPAAPVSTPQPIAA